MAMRADNGGLCIHRSVAFVFDVPGSILVFGTIQPVENPQGGDSPVPFIHCWAEYQGKVFAPTTIEQANGQLIAQDKAGYYQVNGITEVYTFTRPQLLRLDREYRLKRYLLTGKLPGKGYSFGATLLDAAGVPWKDYGDGGIVPPYVKSLHEDKLSA